jgi:hypothetical protein
METTEEWFLHLTGEVIESLNEELARRVMHGETGFDIRKLLTGAVYFVGEKLHVPGQYYQRTGVILTGLVSPYEGGPKEFVRGLSRERGCAAVVPIPHSGVYHELIDLFGSSSLESRSNSEVLGLRASLFFPRQ